MLRHSYTFECRHMFTTAFILSTSIFNTQFKERSFFTEKQFLSEHFIFDTLMFIVNRTIVSLLQIYIEILAITFSSMFLCVHFKYNCKFSRGYTNLFSFLTSHRVGKLDVTVKYMV